MQNRISVSLDCRGLRLNIPTPEFDLRLNFGLCCLAASALWQVVLRFFFVQMPNSDLRLNIDRWNVSSEPMDSSYCWRNVISKVQPKCVVNTWACPFQERQGQGKRNMSQVTKNLRKVHDSVSPKPLKRVQGLNNNWPKKCVNKPASAFKSLRVLPKVCMCEYP